MEPQPDDVRTADGALPMGLLAVCFDTLLKTMSEEVGPEDIAPAPDEALADSSGELLASLKNVLGAP